MRQIYNVESPPSSMLYDTSALNDGQLQLQNSCTSITTIATTATATSAATTSINPCNHNTTLNNTITTNTTTIISANTTPTNCSPMRQPPPPPPTTTTTTSSLYESGLCNLHDLAKNYNLVGQPVKHHPQYATTKSMLTKSNYSSSSSTSACTSSYSPSRLSLANLMPSRFAFHFSRFP